MSATAIIYRVQYRRANWKPRNWKTKLFNSEESARKYADNLCKPVTDKTPEKFRELAAATVRLSFGVCAFQVLPDEDGVVEQYQEATGGEPGDIVVKHR